ncbi:MAG TPA: response regulator [Verrucomicrobiae bacterium]|nr:response regulator [Verrucomicrobiae bacterium]
MTAETLEPPVRLLYLEDDETDQVLVRQMLRAEGVPCEMVTVKTRADFEAALRRGNYDLIISDFSLPAFDGLSALSIARELSPGTPFIFFSGTIGEDVAVASLKNGAADYILKQHPHRLVSAVRNALHNAGERSRLQRAEMKLKKIEDRFRIVSRATNDVIWEWDVKTNRVWLSDNFTIVYGHAPETVSATLENWMDLIHPDDKHRVVSGVTALIAVGGRVWWSEHRFRRADGAYAHVFDRASVVYDAAGKLARMVGVMIDMTERMRAEEKIIEQAALLDEAQDAIIVSDLNGCIQFWSKGAERIYGRTFREVVGKSADELLRPAAQLSQTAIAETLQAGHWIGELREQTKSGREVIVQSRWTLLRDGQGNPKSIMVINTDVTAPRQLEEQFLRAQRLESLGVLVSGIAHDLNNALVPIVVGIQLLRENAPPEQNESLLLTMETSAKRSADMLRQMLTFARGGEIKKTVVHPAQLVKEMGKIVADIFPKSIQCRVQISQTPHPIACIPTQLQQVLMNLCVNARDALPNGGTITLNVKNVPLTPGEAARHKDAKPGDYVCFSVADTGEGIPSGCLEKIFQPFFTTKLPGKGTGLGLSTSLNIIRSHDGFMTVHSEAGHGAEFKVYLPAAGNAVAELAPEKISLPAGDGECILVVDDEAAILAILRAALENYGYTVVTAASVPEAINYLRANDPAIHLVIINLDMPFMDNRVTMTTLRKMSPGLKFISVAGSEKSAENAQCRSNADAFVVKPFTDEVLITAVHKALRQPVQG